MRVFLSAHIQFVSLVLCVHHMMSCDIHVHHMMSCGITCASHYVSHVFADKARKAAELKARIQAQLQSRLSTVRQRPMC